MFRYYIGKVFLSKFHKNIKTLFFIKFPSRLFTFKNCSVTKGSLRINIDFAYLSKIFGSILFIYLY